MMSKGKMMNEKMYEQKLKSCPFCGGKAKIVKQDEMYYAECGNDNCTVVVNTRHCKNLYEVVKLWNERKDDNVIKEPETMKWIYDVVGAVYYCDQCGHISDTNIFDTCPNCGRKRIKKV